ncbi:MAG: PfkB family carbohydrate kinase [Bacteroidales bacterium]|nr:PfkB family carbohydrate kinase [Bacteroidales bacterium]
MKKIICIGECSLDIIFDGSDPVGAMPGGRVVNAAAILARDKFEVVMASEASTDPVGDRVVSFLASAGVDTRSVDRFTEGRTPLTVFTQTADGELQLTRYEDYPDDCFDIVWPRVDDKTIVVFGGYYAIDRRMRGHMLPFLNHCAEMGAVLVYIPGFLPGRESRITRVMPAILENLELAHVVISRNRDLQVIFGVDSGDRCYADHIDFYCRSMINVDPACRMINYFSGKEVTHAEIPESICESLMWNAGVVAGVVASIAEQDLTPEQLDTPAADIRTRVLTAAVDSAAKAASGLKAEWQRHR